MVPSLSLTCARPFAPPTPSVVLAQAPQLPNRAACCERLDVGDVADDREIHSLCSTTSSHSSIRRGGGEPESPGNLSVCRAARAFARRRWARLVESGWMAQDLDGKTLRLRQTLQQRGPPSRWPFPSALFSCQGTRRGQR